MEAVRIFNLVTISVSMGIVGAIAWSLRYQPTVPKYVKYVVVGYVPFAVFALAATQDAYRRDLPITWVTYVATVAGLAGIASGVWAWWNNRVK